MGDPDTGSSGNGLKRQLESLWDQKKPLFHSWFKVLLLLSLLLYPLCYMLSDRSVLLWERFQLHRHYTQLFNRTYQVRLPPYQVHPKHRLIEGEIHKTTPGGIQYHYVYPHNYQFIIDNTEVCKNTPFLVLMVPVKPDNVKARDAIRRTWAKDSVVQGEQVVTLFMLGISGGIDAETLKKENLHHQDLIQSNFIDSYFNLTIKTMVIMDWVATHCQTAAYAMKVDSDMFLNIDNLVIMLQKPGLPKVNYLTGMLMWNRPVVRSNNSKWYVPEEILSDPEYPTYTLGMGYIFSSDLPEKIVEASKFTKPFNIEDAYIGMCMKMLGLAPTSPPDPSQFKAYNTRYDRCEFSKIITYILDSPQRLVNYWKDFKKPGPYCEKV
ncbi:beta-1,3-galactosyltransferase 1-like [Cololabis saira]|uniref:beta-1,3-galactosyltransferase 1-like n=1 Tax=Cololabis saira TaxID=129043 RepID=UPI002AD4FD00|nr:beta-1,3-galactosyltransferase 1-like [Cololabis saira]